MYTAYIWHEGRWEYEDAKRGMYEQHKATHVFHKGKQQRGSCSKGNGHEAVNCADDWRHRIHDVIDAREKGNEGQGAHNVIS